MGYVQISLFWQLIHVIVLISLCQIVYKVSKSVDVCESTLKYVQIN